MSLVYFDGMVLGAGVGRVSWRRRRLGGRDGHQPGGAFSRTVAVAHDRHGIGLHNFAEGLAIGESAAAARSASPRARDRVRAPQRDRGFRHRRAVGGESGRPGASSRDGPDRRRPDLRRHADRPGLVNERSRRVPRARRRVDPLRRDRAARRAGARPQTAVAWGMLLGLMLGFATDSCSWRPERSAFAPAVARSAAGRDRNGPTRAGGRPARVGSRSVRPSSWRVASRAWRSDGEWIRSASRSAPACRRARAP